MKKLFTLFVAALLAMSANAAGPLKIQGNKIVKTPVSSVITRNAFRAQTDMITTQPEGELKTYTRSGQYTGVSNQQLSVGTQTGSIKIVFGENNKVYLQNPVSSATTGVWVEGTLSEDGKTISVPVGQKVYFDDEENYGLILTFGHVGVNSEGKLALTEANTDVVTYTIDGDTIKLNNTSGDVTDESYDWTGVTLKWTDDNTWSGYMDINSVYTIAAPHTAQNIQLVGTGASLTDKTATDGTWRIIFYGDDYALQLTTKASQINGTYTEEDLDLSSSVVLDMNTNDIVNITDADFKVTANGGLHVFEGTATLDNGDTVEFRLTEGDNFPSENGDDDNNQATAEAIDIDLTAGTSFDDYTADEGWWQLIGASDDQKYMVSLSNSYNDAVVGTYTTSDMDLSYTYVQVKNDAGTYDKKKTVSADVTVTAGANEGEYNFVAKLVTSDGQVYNIKCNYAATLHDAFLYDEKQTPLNLEYTTDQVTLSTQYFEQYGIVQFVANNENNNYTALEFYPESLNEKTILSAGEYPIAAEGENTVAVSEGIDEDGYLIGSWSGIYTGTAVQQPFYFLTAGKVVVTETASGVLEYTITATNSNNVPVNITVKAPVTDGINSVTSTKADKTVKFFSNGQLRIQKAGKVFNAAGQQLKK